MAKRKYGKLNTGLYIKNALHKAPPNKMAVSYTLTYFAVPVFPASLGTIPIEVIRANTAAEIPKPKNIPSNIRRKLVIHINITVLSVYTTS